MSLIGTPTTSLGGLTSGTYASGESITGSVGQTCIQSSFHNGTGSTASATVALTGTNIIGVGTNPVSCQPLPLPSLRHRPACWYSGTAQIIDDDGFLLKT
jgi:hypothetical protein